MVNYFTRCVHNESIKLLSLHVNELIEKFKKHEGKKFLMVNDYMLDNVLDMIKEILYIEKFDDATILIDTDDKFTNDITLKKFMILMTWFIKDDGKFCP